MPDTHPWPELPLDAWQDTYDTLHRWTQIVGKIRLAQSPWLNHSWHVPLYVTARGLTTAAMPFGSHALELQFDFLDHMLRIDASDGAQAVLPLQAEAVADFYARVMATLDDLGFGVQIHGAPNEVQDPIPFAEDRTHAAYDPDYAQRFWRVLVHTQRVMQRFRAPFIGKNSPVHFFWGSFDLAVTRFSGRPAPEHPGGIPNLPDWVAKEAYSHEVSSAGFWPGGGPHPFPLFYSYAYPGPDGFADAAVQPDAAFYSEALGEFVLPYDAVREAPDPDAALYAFLQSTYVAAADLGGWDRGALERNDGFGP